MWVIQCSQNMDQGAFPRTGNTQDGKRLAPTDGEVETFQDFNCVTILDKGLIKLLS